MYASEICFRTIPYYSQPIWNIDPRLKSEWIRPKLWIWIKPNGSKLRLIRTEFLIRINPTESEVGTIRTIPVLYRFYWKIVDVSTRILVLIKTKKEYLTLLFIRIMKKSYKHKLKLEEREKYIPKDKFPIIFNLQHSDMINVNFIVINVFKSFL